MLALTICDDPATQMEKISDSMSVVVICDGPATQMELRMDPKAVFLPKIFKWSVAAYWIL